MHKVFFIEILSQTLKLYLIYLFLSKIGIIIGSFLLYFLLISYRYLIKKIFHLQYVSFDKSLMGFSSRDQYTINLLSLFDRTDSSPSTFEPSVFKKTIITRVISQIPKMRSKIVYKLLNFYWEETPIEEAISKIQIISLPNKESLQDYLDSHVSKRIDNYNNIPYEIYIIKYDDNTGGAVHFKFDHVASDGLGFLSMLCFLSDDFSPELFPKIMNGKYTYSALRELKDTILFPLHIFIAIYTILFSSWERTDFKIMYHPTHLGDSKYAMSKWYDISEIRKVRQKYSVSFNDSVVGIIMRALPKTMNDKVSGLNIVIPCGYTSKPQTAKDIEMGNEAQGFLMYIPFITSFTELPKLSKIIRRVFSTSITSIPLFLFRLLGEVFPMIILNLVSNYIIFKVDMLISNCPGPDIECKLCGWTMTDFYPVVSSGRMKSFITIGSYNKKFRYVAAYDKSVRYEPKQLISEIDVIMNDIINGKLD